MMNKMIVLPTTRQTSKAMLAAKSMSSNVINRPHHTTATTSKKHFSFLTTRHEQQSQMDDLVSPLQLKSIKDFVQSANKKPLAPPAPKTTTPLSQINLDSPLHIPNSQIVTPILHFKNDSDVKMTRLDNGLRVASIDNQTKMSVINVLFGVGPRYEAGSSERGMSILLNKMSFKSSRKFDAKAIAAVEDKIIYESRCEHETLSYSTSCYRDRIESSIELISDSILYPRLEQSEIDATIEELEFNMQEQMLDPIGSAVLADMVMDSCFGASETEASLGNPTLHINHGATTESLKAFQRRYFVPSNCVITGVGVDHDEFVKLVEKHFTFEDASGTTPVLKSAHDFISGDRRLEFLDPPQEYLRQNMPSLTSMVLSFEGVDVYDRESIFAIYILETLLGGGNSFSSGGPGKGLQSLIYNEYLTRYRLYGMVAQHSSFRDTGVFSIQASATHDYASSIPNAITKLCAYMTRQITDEYVERAKVQFKAMLLHNLEHNASLASNISADFLYFGRANGTDYLTTNIDKITKHDIHRVMTKLLTGKPPAIAVVGDLSKIPPKEQFDDFFQSLSSKLRPGFSSWFK